MANTLWIDIETTGLGTNSAVIEIAAIPMIDGEIRPHFHSMIRPHKGATLDPKAFEITKIDINEIWNYPEAKDVLNEFIKWIDSHETFFSISGHNVSFDRRHTYKLFCRNGFYGDFIHRFNNRDTCTLSIAREIYKGKKNKPSSFTLEELCKHFDIQVNSSHRALDDIQRTIKVYEELCKIREAKIVKDAPLSFHEKRTKYLDMKYIQLNPEGDVFLTRDALTDPNARVFILNHLYELYSD